MFESKPQSSAPAKSAPPAAISVPAGASKPKEPETVIRVMPAEYYGISPKTPVKKTSVPIMPPPPIKLPPPSKPPAVVPASGVVAKKRKIPVVLIVGLLLLVVIGVGGFLLLRSLKPSSPPVIVTNVTPPPTNTTPTAQCGNLVCETGETSTSCSVDCVPTPPPPPPPIRSGIDNDSDGLTDAEELELYGSNPQNPDTDRDSFIDGNEVFNLYDPTKPSPVSLVVNDEFYVADDRAFGGYQLLVPRDFKYDISGAHDDEIKIPSGETVSVDFIAREDGITKETVWNQKFPGKSFTVIELKGGFSGLRSIDQRSILFEIPGYEVLFIYELGTKRTVEYLRTFEMMLNSFRAPITTAGRSTF